MFKNNSKSIYLKITDYFFYMYLLSILFLFLFFIIYKYYFELYFNIGFFDDLFILLLIFFFLYFFLYFSLKKILKKVILERINRIQKEMLLIKQDNFSQKRIRINGIDEIDELAHLTNVILDKYQKNIEIEKKHSLIDSLTLSFNRRALNLDFNSLCEKVNRKKLNFSMLLFDIDDFKKVNDTYGHDVGDKVLKNLSSLIKNSLRKYDSFYRVGGEEFIIIFNQLSNRKLQKIISRLQKNISYHLKKSIPIIKGNITVSGGLVQSKDFDFNENYKKILDLMFKSCDELLYKAKNSGKNKIMFK